MPKVLIFTDLDGTLLHPLNYSFDEARPALQLIKERDIPLVLVSSKTRAEIEVWRMRLRNVHPFISENGGGVYVPAGYFSFAADGELQGDYAVNVLGTSYEQIRREFIRLRNELKIGVKGFGDMTDAEVAALTGLSHEEAALARQREFDEPFVFEQGPDAGFLKAIEERGFRWTRGRLYHIMGESDKGRAVRMLKKWYVGEYGRIISIGLGDGLNDLSLLKEVDHPVLVRKEDGTHDADVSFPGLMRTRGIGPAGWSEAVLEFLKKNI